MNLLFAHANGYPPESYRSLLAAMEQALAAPVATHAHRPLTTSAAAPTFLSWQVYASDLIARIEADARGPVWAIGHSMGAASAILAAARRPELFSGIVALDPVLVRTRVWLMSRIMRLLKPDAMPIVRRALARPHEFSSEQAAFDFYRGKRVFSGVRDDVLMDYVIAGHTAESEGGVRLRHSGAWEACIYRSVPRMTPALRSLRCPMLVVAGERSDVLQRETLNWVLKQNRVISAQSLPGGHLLPLESPETCAGVASKFIVEQAAS